MFLNTVDLVIFCNSLLYYNYYIRSLRRKINLDSTSCNRHFFKFLVLRSCWFVFRWTDHFTKFTFQLINHISYCILGLNVGFLLNFRYSAGNRTWRGPAQNTHHRCRCWDHFRMKVPKCKLVKIADKEFPSNSIILI